MTDEPGTRFSDLRSAIPLEVGELDTVEDVFEYGWCHALAIELHDRTGWPTVGLQLPDRPYDGGPPIPPHFRGDVVHYAVQRPDGLIVDVRGARRVAEMGIGIESGQYRVVNASADRLRNPSDMENPADVADLARLVADRLLADPTVTTSRTSVDLVRSSYPISLRESLQQQSGRRGPAAAAPNADLQLVPQR
jgi:hypothetical protein